MDSSDVSATLDPSSSSATEQPPSVPTPVPAAPAVDLRQHAFLLQQFAAAPGQNLTAGDVNKKIPRAVQKALGLTPDVANEVRKTLVEQQHLSAHKDGRKVFYKVTDQGRAYLQTLTPYEVPDAKPRGAIIPPSSDTVRREREAFLLLSLLKAPHQRQTKGDANKSLGSKALAMNRATAAHVRQELADKGMINIEKGPRTAHYTLTPAGRLQLGGLEFYGNSLFSLRGRVLNELLEAARDAAKQFEAPERKPAVPVSTAEIAHAVMEEFNALRREKYHSSGMVPIHEVRQHIRSLFGDAAGRHDIFDEVIRQLRQEGRLRLSSISDHSRATPEELQDSIPGVGETLFNLEVAHESALA